MLEATSTHLNSQAQSSLLPSGYTLTIITQVRPVSRQVTQDIPSEDRLRQDYQRISLAQASA